MNIETEVVDINWITASTGQVRPLIRVPMQKIKYDKNKTFEFDGFMLSSLKDIQELKIGKGAKITLELEPEDGALDVSSVIEPVTKIMKPHKCMYCDKKVIEVQNEILCVNHLCQGQGRSGIFKLIIAAQSRPLTQDEVVEVSEYLNNFPCNSDYGHIDSFHEYLNLFFQEVNKIGTPERRKYMDDKRCDGFDTDYIEKLEGIVLETLNKGLPDYKFWYVINLPGMSEKEMEELAKIPLDKIKKAKKKYHSVLNNMEYINAILSLFADFRKKIK